MSTATLSRPRVVAACEYCIREVDLARAATKERALDRIQRSRWAWLERRWGQITRDEARERLASQEYDLTRWSIEYLNADMRNTAERILNLARVSDAYTMEISDKDFEYIGGFYNSN